MPTANTLLLIAHIICGYLALTAGTVLLFARKGNKSHRALGRVFFYAMMGVSASAIYLAIARNIPFLLFIGIFVFYQVFAGFRSVKNKDLRPRWTDGLVLLIAFVNGLFMIKSLNPVLVAFGVISLFLVYTDLKIYYRLYKKMPIRKWSWLARHLGMMMGGYIGALTAFLVVNVKGFEPAWVVWLAPTVLLLPLMRYWTWKYTQRPFLKSQMRSQ